MDVNEWENERAAGHTDWSLKPNKKRTKFHWIIQYNAIKHWIVWWVCVYVSFTQHWASKQLKSNSIKCHTHKHFASIVEGIGWHVFWFVCYNGISEHIGETFNQPEMIWKILNEGIYELRFLFAIVLFSVSVIAQHNTSFWCVIISDMEHWISLSDNNKQGLCQHVSLSHTVWCAWVCACVCIWLTAQNLWSNCFDTLHCGQHIVRCRKIIAFVHHEMRLQYSIDDWSGKIASNGDDEWYTRSMTKQIDMQEISQHQFIIEKQ